MIELAESSDSGINLGDLLRHLGLVVGAVKESESPPSSNTPSSSDKPPAVEFDSTWFHDPIASLREMPADERRRAALADLVGDVLPAPLPTPTLDQTGKPDATKWFPFPHPTSSPEMPAPTGVFLLTDAEAEALIFGLGLFVRMTVEQTAIAPFVALPLVSLPAPPGNPVLFLRDGQAYPVMVGVRVTVPTASIPYDGKSWDTLQVQVRFNIGAPAESTVSAFFRTGTDDFEAGAVGATNWPMLADAVLGLGDVASWLNKPIIPDNDTGPTVGRLLVAAGLLTKTDGTYALGSLDEIEHLTFQSLLENFLPALGGLRLVEIHGAPDQGLFLVVEVPPDAPGATRYGLRLAVSDIVLSGGDSSTSEGAADDPAKPDKADADTSTLTLQLGSGFDSRPEQKPGGSGARAGGVVSFLATEGGDAKTGEAEPATNWTNSESPLGISLTLLEKDDAGAFAFKPHVELVSVGIDYVNDGPNGLVNARGFQLAGIQPRIYLSFGGTFGFGAAIRVEDLEIPLDATLGPTSAQSNAVAANLISAKSDASVPEGGKLPPARTKFSASAALDAHGTFHATLYDAGRNPTTDPIWFNVEKAFGPVSLQKLGVAWADTERTLSWLVDGGVALGGLTLDLEQLSITFPVTDFASTRLGLKGIEVGFNGGGIEISGGFIEIDSDDGVEYDGQAFIKVASFTLSALGGYGVSKADNHSSLFVFLLIDIPLGGPPIFFVNGLAGGFGYNRDLKLPTIDDLPSYPLVQGAMGGSGADNPFQGKKDPASALQVLADDIRPSYGQDWLAAGVRFASFEVVQSFVLLTVKFGTTFEIDLLGLSQASVPPGAPDPIANVELALLATFAPDRGFIGLSAKLTDRSYVFSKSCHLTGGFAFYLWFKDDPVSDAPAGQFVVTLGGYHPFFIPPKYFPDEPRLGLDWKVSDALSISGGLYFALTPGAVMAGGYLNALFDAGIVRAWFKAHADFLLGWKPFYYQIGVGIDLGCTIRLPILICTIVITIEVGVDLELWGPPFGGTIVVHLLFISFTIPFGSSSPAPLPIPWDEFTTSFLPAAHPASTSTESKDVARRTFAAAADASTPDQADPHQVVCSVRIGGGLLKDLSDDPSIGIDWVVDPLHIELVVSTVIPAKQIDLITKAGSTTTSLTPHDTVIEFGVGPMAVPAESFSSTLQITVDRLVEGKPDPAYDFAHFGEALGTHEWTLASEPILRNAPKATWDTTAAFNRDVSVLNSGPLLLASTLQGVTLSAAEGDVDATPPIPLETLQAAGDPPTASFRWSSPQIAADNPFAAKQAEAMSVLKETVAAADVVNVRDHMIQELARRGVPVTATASVSELAAHADAVLLADPVLCPLGAPIVEAGTAA